MCFLEVSGVKDVVEVSGVKVIQHGMEALQLEVCMRSETCPTILILNRRNYPVHVPAFELQWGVDQSYGPIRGLFYSVFHNRLWDQKRPISWINPQRFTQTADLRGLVGCSSSTKAQPMCFPSSIEPYTTLKRRPYYRTLYDP